jgi:hypothetical protein
VDVSLIQFNSAEPVLAGGMGRLAFELGSGMMGCPLRPHSVLRPFGACHISILFTQGVALGWLVSGLWPSAAFHFKTLLKL